MEKKSKREYVLLIVFVVILVFLFVIYLFLNHQIADWEDVGEYEKPIVYDYNDYENEYSSNVVGKVMPSDMYYEMRVHVKGVTQDGKLSFEINRLIGNSVDQAKKEKIETEKIKSSGAFDWYSKSIFSSSEKENTGLEITTFYNITDKDQYTTYIEIRRTYWQKLMHLFDKVG